MTLLRLGRSRRPPPPPPLDAADVTKEVRRIDLRSRRLMDSPALGSYESVFRGHGIEFSEVRAYEPGDPFQSIDWKVTARMRKPYVKRFVEERELTVLLAIDLSASTTFGTRGRLKRRLASEVAGVLALAAIRSQDRVGLLLFTDRVERYVRPLRGRNRSMRLLHELLSYQPVGHGTDIPIALTTAARLLRVRSLVFVVSDFVSSDPLAQSLLGLSRRHDVVAVDLKDPFERTLPRAGLIEVEDAESGERRIVDLANKKTRDQFAAAGRQEDELLDRTFRRCHVDRIRIHTDRPYAPELAAFFAARARQRRR